MLYPFSYRAAQSRINFLVFITPKLLAKILASAYYFAVNIVMLINFTINKTFRIHATDRILILSIFQYSCKYL